MNMAVNDTVSIARQLRTGGNINGSWELINRDATFTARQPLLLWQHHPFFWQELQGGNCLLTRRTGSDAEFIQQLWQDTDFVQQFHRMAISIPQDLNVLRRILNSEFISLIGDLGSIHWVVRDAERRCWGILSLTNISLIHKRAEVLLGVKHDAPFGLATAAMLLLFKFFFGVMQFHKLYTLTFSDKQQSLNDHALKGVLHLGFKIEAEMREHFFDKTNNRYIDMTQAGLLAADAFAPGNRRLMQRLNIQND